MNTSDSIARSFTGHASSADWLRRVSVLLFGLLLGSGVWAENSELVEKASALEAILEETDEAALVTAFLNASSIGGSLKDIQQHMTESTRAAMHEELFELLSKNVGETAIRTFDLNELQLLRELHAEGGEKRALVLKVICLSAASDHRLMSPISQLMQKYSRAAIEDMKRRTPPSID